MSNAKPQGTGARMIAATLSSTLVWFIVVFGSPIEINNNESLNFAILLMCFFIVFSLIDLEKKIDKLEDYQ